MITYAPVYLLLAAAVVAVFAFASVALKVTTQSRERQYRDRLALLKTLVEHPGEASARVLDLLREEDEKRAKRKEQEEAKGFLAGGFVCLAVGIGISVMVAALDAKPGAWTAGLMVALVGVALLPFGFFPRSRASRKGPDA